MPSRLRMVLRFSRTYLCVWLPLLCISLIVAQGMRDRLVLKEQTIIALRLREVCQELDNLYSDYYGISVQLGSLVELSPRRMTASSLDAYKGIRYLRLAMLSDPNAWDVFLYYGTNDVYSRQGFSNLNTYLLKTLGAREVQSITSILGSDAIKALFSWQNGNTGFVILHYPIHKGMGKQTSSVNYCISAKKLWETLGRLTDPQPLYVRLRFQDGTDVLFDESGKLSPAASDGGAPNPRMNGLTISDTAQAFGIDVDAYYDPKGLYVDVNAVRWLNLALIMVGAVISVGLSFALSLNRIVRIEQLEKTVNDLSELPANATVPAQPGDEYGRIRAILRPMRQEFNNLRINQQLYQSVLKQQTLHLLFHHFFKNRTEVNNALSVSGMELFEEQFYVFGIALRGTEDLPDALAGRFADKLSCEETLPGRTLLYVLEELPNLDLSQSLRVASAEDLIQQLQIAGAEVIGIAVSRVYQNAYLASFAYQEVRGLLEAMAEEAHFELKVAQDTSRGESEPVKLDAQELNRFLNAVQNREIPAAKHALVRMNGQISVDAKDIREQQYLRFCLLQSLISCLQSSQTSGALIDSLIRIDPSDETAFEETINGLLERYIADTTPQDSFRSIVNYIREHYADCNLTAEEVAAFGGFNKTYLSRLFKSKIQMSYIDFLTHIRMNEAKKLLRSTNLSVREIVARIGYIDDSSFRRKFKSLFGVSVAEYRADYMHDPEKGEDE